MPEFATGVMKTSRNMQSISAVSYLLKGAASRDVGAVNGNPPVNTGDTGLIAGPGTFHIPWGN